MPTHDNGGRFRHRIGRNGFTLSEITIVISIIGILAAIAVPGYFRMRPRMELKQTARNLMADMEYARMQAIKRNIPIAVHFQPGTESYQIIDKGSDNVWGGTDDVYKTVKINVSDPAISFGSLHDAYAGDPVAATSSPDDGIHFPNQRVVFSPDTTSTLGTVYLKNDRGDTLAISCVSNAGQIQIFSAFGSEAPWSN